jgi:hypothetical protein
MLLLSVCVPLANLKQYKWINMLIYFVANWYAHIITFFSALTLARAVKMSILALYHRIGSGKRGLPLIVQSRAIWVTAGFISAFTLAVILVRPHSTPMLAKQF